MPGTLFVVATPIGNLEDITVRALRILREVSLIAAEDTRRTARLLARHGIKTPTTSLHEHNEAAKSPELVERLRRGESIALVSDAGTPGISDPGQGLVREAIAAQVRVESIPGPSAIMAALASSGFDSNRFAFLGFPPIRSQARTEWFGLFLSCARTVVFFEAPHRIRTTLEQLRDTIGDCEVLVSRELTKVHEESFRGSVTAALLHFLKPLGEFTVVVLVGQMANIEGPELPSGASLLAELGRMTAESRLTRRKAISILAKRYGRPPNEVYDSIETAKKSGF